MRLEIYLVTCAIAAGCGGANGNDGAGAPDAAAIGDDSSAADAQADSSGYLIYAHSNTTLYSVNIKDKTLVTVGDFGVSDVMTDLAVAPNGTIFTVSYYHLFTVDPMTAKATRVASLSTCGQQGVALTSTIDGRMWIGDYMGEICELDYTQSPPVVKPPVTMSDGYALAGDMVGIGDGTVFGTAYKLDDSATETNNYLIKLDPATGQVTPIGPSGFPRLYGTAFQQNKVFGFTHDGSGRVVTIDLANGTGAMFGTFKDPTQSGIAFAGAGVNPHVDVIF
jgi:hypothetical protein